MQIEGRTVLVTGANRGLGKALVDIALSRGAAKIYAAVRDPAKAEAVFAGRDRVCPIALDVTQDRSVAALATACPDVDILVNNAAVIMLTPLIGPADTQGARLEMETNYWGVLRMCRAFAPILARNGGGAIMNILSLGALASIADCGSYCATKAAAWSLTQCARVELAGQRTHVMAVLAGGIVSEMSAHLQDRSVLTEPAVMADNIYRGLLENKITVFPDPLSRMIGERFVKNPWDIEAVHGGWKMAN